MALSVRWLDEPGAADARLCGAKASNLATARLHGLPVFDGFVLRSDEPESLAGAASWGVPQTHDSELRTAWAKLSRSGSLPLAVRSSSVLEDSTESSMAGQFLTVLDVRGWDAFTRAISDVIASGAPIPDARGEPSHMAVLVQPMGNARLGGVMFGVDPLTGDRSHILVAAAPGLPVKIVSGEETGDQFVLGPRGRLRSKPARRLSRHQSGESESHCAVAIGARHRRQLAHLARSAEELFDGPQDIEWLIDEENGLRMLQSRPITASALPPEGGHLLGSGPVAETFPNPLSRLERDLWESPLEDGIREAVRIGGAVNSRTLAGRLVVNVGGRVAVDLESLGVAAPRRTWWQLLDPRPPGRRLLSGWRVGRLRIALPSIAHDLVVEVDGDLRALDTLDQLGDVQLLRIMTNARRTLAALHAHEVMAGFFIDTTVTTATGASVALSTLARARLDGLSDDEIVVAHPNVLALVPSRVGGSHGLPATPSSPPLGERTHEPRRESHERLKPRSDTAMGLAREALRLRVRWVQELTAQVALELGSRLETRGQIGSADDVRHLDLRSLHHAAEFPDTQLAIRPEEVRVPPLPDRFRLAVDGTVVPDLAERAGMSGGSAGGPRGVSSGRVIGCITHDPSDAASKILVVRSLDPALAGAVSVASGLVAEIGSPLSHLAILAREYGVPAVAGMSGATANLHDGDRVLLDGQAGTIEVIVDGQAPMNDPRTDGDCADPNRVGADRTHNQYRPR